MVFRTGRSLAAGVEPGADRAGLRGEAGAAGVERGEGLLGKGAGLRGEGAGLGRERAGQAEAGQRHDQGVGVAVGSVNRQGAREVLAGLVGRAAVEGELT